MTKKVLKKFSSHKILTLKKKKKSQISVLGSSMLGKTIKDA